MSVAELSTTPDLQAGWRPVRLGTLVGLRWLAIGGQAISVLFVAFGLGFPLPLPECMSLIALSVLLNLWLLLRFGEGYRPVAFVATAQLAWDLCQLGALLALTGGLENPFSLLLLAPVSVSATTLPQRSTYSLAGLAMIIASVLSVAHLPLPWAPGVTITLDRVYTIGIWVSLLCGVTFVAAYTNRVALEARQLADALALTELALSQHEQLRALDGLAAAAAHELGTPLSTIALAAREMLHEAPPGQLRDDAALIVSQTRRCREILGKLRSLRDTPGDPFAAVPVKDLLAEIAKPLEGGDKAITIHAEGNGPQPVVKRSTGLLYGLNNLIENASQFARGNVVIDAAWDRSTLVVTFTDDGPGFPVDLIARIGEPYLTTRARGPEHQPGGLGLGVFIAKTLLERSGARLSFENVGDGGGARVRIVWPRKAIEMA